MPDTDSYTGLEIAIIGLAGKFPGASDIDTFWKNLKNGVESISFFSNEELLSSGFDDQLINHADFVKAAGVIEGKEYFDSWFFGYLPDEASAMDPQIRLFHQCVWEALEDAGYNPTTYEGAIGLYAGAGSSFNWEAYSILAGIGASIDGLTASQLRDRSSLAVVVSYKLNLKGPSFTLHTACSTSLVATHQACQALICGECDMAVAGGVSLLNSAQKGYLYREGMIMSPDGHCRAFDAMAKGTVGGEAAAVTVLKPLDNAMKGGDNIHAIIKGSYVNNDGVRKLGYTAPSVEGQAEVIRNALSAAEVEPESITYIETHGTGTPLGDPVEVEALSHVFGVVDRKKWEKYCALGSLKTNTGHLDTAAGGASLIKTVLALKHRQIPPSLHFNTPNPKIDFENCPFYVNKTLRKWENHRYPLRAGVSSFGIGGTNVHIVLEECPKTYNKESSSPSREYQLIIFSAKNASVLDRMTENLKEYLKKNLANPANPGLNLADAAYTMQTGRQVYPYRRMLVCKDTREAVDILSHPALEKVKTFTFKPGKGDLPIVFMFSGQGTQYVNMGLELYRSEPVFRQEMDRCFSILKSFMGLDIKEILYPSLNTSSSGLSSQEGIDHTKITQPVLFIFEYALAKLLSCWGIKPGAMIGYSYGEYVAACLAGVFSLEEALNLVVLRGKLIATLPPGAMLSVPLPEKELLPLLNDELSLAVVNGPSCIVSGSEEAVAAFEKQMKQRKLLCIKVGLTHAAHSTRMEAISGEFEKHVGKIPLCKPKIPYISNVSGTWIKDDEAADPSYWSTHLTSTVRFAQGLQELLKAADSIFIEIGPGKALSNFVRQHPAKTTNHLVINLVRDKNERKSDLYYLSDRLGRLWLYGVEIDWQQFYLEERRKKISLPTYPFEKNKYPLGQNVFQMVSEMLRNRGEAPHVDADRMPEGFTFTEPVREPEITVERPELVTSYIEPSTPTEQALVEMWQNFFGIGRIGIADDFFELGGDSLKAMTLLAKIHQRFDAEILLTGFFANSTIKDLANLVDSSVKKEFEFIEPVEEKEYYPLSSAQKRLFILQEMVEGSTAYNLPQFIPFGQDVEIERLEKGFEQLIQRHESLRTSFHMVNKEPIQRIHKGAAHSASKGVDFDIEHETDITAFIRPFDLSRAPLIRVGLVKADQGNYLLMVDMHHIISDGVSLNLLEKEFKALYRDPDIQLPELRLQYKDFSQWQHREEWQETLKNQEKYWLNEFPDELPVLNLIADFQRPVVQSFEGSMLNFYLGEKESAQLKKLAQTHNVTFYMALLCLFIIFLSKLSGQEDIIVGTGVAGRRHPDLEKIIGMFVNTLPLRSQPAGTKMLATFLEEVKEKTLYAFENQEYPFEDLIEKIDVPRDTSRNPLFDVLFILQSQAEYGGEIPEDTTKITYGGDFVSKFDITLNAVELDNGILFVFEYCTKIFKVDTIERFAGYLKRITASVIRDPEQRLSGIDIFTPQEREQLIYDFNDTYGGYSADKTLHELFEEQAARTPDHTAVIDVEQLQITYKELNEKSNQLAQVLRQEGVQTDTIVGLKVERSIEMIIGILGILKAGGAYLPIDPEYPRERMDYMLKDSNAVLLLTSDELSDVGKDKGTGYCAPTTCNLHLSLAYVIYTSGTTGKPKGNLTTHRNVVRVIKDTNYIELTENDRILQLSNYAFDGSVFDIYGALLNGAALVLVGKEEVFDVDKLSSLITRENITLFFVTTALFNTLVDLDIGCLKNVRKVLFGGERVSVEHTWRALEFLGKGRIMHMYGPTETTVYASSFDIDSVEEGTVTIPIGGPISRTSIYILNENLNPQPIGVKGELYIGGDGLARGYLNHPELTAEKFLSVSYRSYRSYRSYISKKIYRTGDLARWLPDGSIEFLGRIDKQVKIRGFRVEPGEIENRLLKLDEIKEAVVTFSDNYLCAYYVTGEETVNTPGSVELKEYLSHTLPNYMIPTHFIRVEKMPLTPNGKVDIKALPAPIAISDVVYTAPENEVEKRLVEIWSEMLDQPHHSLGIDDNFFDLGGHSLKATIMAAAIHKEFNVKLPLEVIFRESTIRKLSQTIEGSTETQYASIKPAETREYYALSSAQKRMYVLQQMNINNTSYNILAAMPIEGSVEKERLEETFRKLIKRHENFRTSFDMLNDQPVQLVHQEVDFEIEYYDSPTGELPTISDFIRPFDLSKAPLLRVGLTKLEENKHLLMVDMHHIISDGTSQQILTQDFLALYIEHEPKPLRLQYKDFSIWQDALFASGKIKNQEKYWLNLYEDEIPKLDLPVDYPRPGIFTFAGGRYQFNVDKEDTRQLRELGKRKNTTIFMNIMAVFNVLLYKYTTQDDIVVGSAVAGRPHADLQGVIGMFVNMLPIRNYPKGNKRFIDFVEEVREHSLKAFENQDMQFEELIDQLNLDRDPSRNPLFDVSMVAQNFDRSEWRQSTGTGVGEEIGTSKFDMTLFIMETANQVRLSLEYYKGIFKDETIERFAGHLLKVLHQVVENPFAHISDLNIIGEEERQTIIYDFNRIESGYTGDKTIHELFEEQATRTPGHTAVVGVERRAESIEQIQIIYYELDEKSNQLANLLREKGVQPDTIVGLMVERSIEMIIGILGILKAGGAYLPIDPEYPRERRDYMLKDSNAALLLTTDELSDVGKGKGTGYCAPTTCNQHLSLAYVIYTSGTTGKPKGTLTVHQNVVRVVKNTNYIELKENDRILQLSNYVFDGSVFDIYAALLNGAALVLVGKEEVFDVAKLSRLIERESITLFFVTTALFNILVDLDIRCLKNVRKILFGGEQVSVEHARKALEYLGKGRIIHVYGPTETTVYASYYKIESIEAGAVTIPIGRSISNTVLYVLDENLRPQPVGVKGEIYIGGEGLARGYLNRPELTAKKFLSDSYRSYISKKIYKTGDLARWLPDGNIEFLGRKDWQVKIRGYRVELGEIESVLLQHDEINEVAVVAIESENKSGVDGSGDGTGEIYIAAYIVSDRRFDPSELRQYLSQHLPDYMKPTYFEQIDAIPLTISGKIDRKALPMPTAVSDTQYAAPRDEIEEKMVEIWAEVLNQPHSSIGIDDNFFDLGGHSLKATLLVSKVHQELAARLPLVQIFKTPSIREVSHYIKETQVERFSAIPRLEEREYYDVSHAQQRVWIQSQEKQASLSFNMNSAYVIEMDIDKQILDNVFKTLIQRHESLRTVFITASGKPKQKILHPDKTGFKVEYIDLRNLRDETLQTRTRELGMSESDTPFDLSKGPLLRVKLIGVKERTFIFLFTMHHIVGDGLSLGVFFREVFFLYRSYREGKANPLPPLRIHYIDYAAWQNEELSGEKLEEVKTYWLEKLGGNLPRLQLPSNKERPKIMTYKGGTVYLNIDGSLTGQLKSLALQQGTTLFMVLLAAFKALLARYTGQTDVIIGTVAACREYAELEKQIGYYLNTLVLRNSVEPGDSFKTLLKKVKETTLAVYEHQLYPFDRLVSDLELPRDVSRHPIFDIVIDMVNYQAEQVQTQENAGGSGVKVSPYATGYDRSKFDLTVYIFEARDQMGIKFEYMTDIYEYETIQRMSERFLKLLKRIAIARESDECLTDLLEEEDVEITFPILQPFSRPKPQIPASYHQERLWFIDQFESGNIYESAPVYHNIPLVLEIHGALDIRLMEQSIREIIRRHEALRTAVITVGNRPVQLIRPTVDFQLTVKDIAQEQRPFLLEREPLIRGMVLQMEANHRFLLVITVHHIIADRYSLQNLSREILLVYDALLKGGSSRLSDLPLQYVDFSQWQQSFTLEALDSLTYYWRWKLRGKIQALELPTDRPRAPIHVYRSGWQSFTFPETLTDKINAFTKQEGISSFVFLLAAFKTLLHRYSHQEEIVVGTSMRNRNQPGTEYIIGPIANLVVLRSSLSEGTSFNDLVPRLKKTVEEAWKYQAMPFDRLVLELKPDVDMSRTALFDVLFQYEEDPFQLPQVNSLKINVIETNLGWGKYDLNMLIQRKESRYSGVLVYNREYHDESTILRFIGNFLVLLEEILKQPHRLISQFNLLTKEEQRQLLMEWNQPRIDYPEDKTLHELFEEQVERNPDRIAVIGLERSAESVEQMQITYQQLNEKSDQLARVLREKGVLADDIVGIKMGRTIEMIIGILGILKAGGAYLPIDPEYPEERIDFMLKDSSAKVLLAAPAAQVEVKVKEKEELIKLIDITELTSSSTSTLTSTCQIGSANLAYIIYTSGTTGKPKGCMITHKNVISLLKNKIQPFDFNENDGWTMFHQYNFDFSVWEMYGALLYGGKLIVIPKMVTRDPGQYLKILKKEKVTVLNQTPSAFYHLSDTEAAQPDRQMRMRYIIFGGEALNPVRLKQWRAKYPDTKLINMFGITETTIHVTYKEIGDKEIEVGTSNIGRPISTLTAYVLDRNLNLVPIGVPGELCVGGEGLARGYLNRPQLTAEKFLDLTAKTREDTRNSSFIIYHSSFRCLYRSGDLVKLLENGDMEYLGRIDHQVKIRGFRIELGEIETQLLKHQSIKEAVVISRRHKTGDGNPNLCAYIVPSRVSEDGTAVEKTANITELRKHLSQVLPDYMIPTYFKQLTRIPLTPNGKVDRRALPEPEEFRPNLQQTYVAPENELETKIAEIWQEILQLDRVGTRDNFFEIGGDSLKTVQLKSRLEQALNRSIPVVTLFERMTIHSFVEYLTGLEKGEIEPELEKKIDRSEAITRAKDSRAKQRLKRKVKSQ